MTASRTLKWWIASTLLAVYSHFGAGPILAQPQPAAGTEGVEVLTRGPVHEAFAGVISFHPEPGAIAKKAPPANIEELPPNQRPDGDNVAWIPGYWAWDDERDDYLWISGIWRALPPRRQWISGYWAASGDNYQWTSGYWADAAQNEVQYLPEPPATVEQGPVGTAPGADQLWIPGTWIWNQNRYAWQPGYWAPAQQNWMWIPSSYSWSPRGYVFVNGYWDYAVARRGMLFCPVYFNANVYSRRGFSYSPLAVINAAVFANQLFLRPNYQHYYFGDYYASSYASAGFYPWFSFNSGGYGYDPFYAQQRWMNRQNPQWNQRIQADYKNRVDNEGARPARTLAAQQANVKGDAKATGNAVAIATPIDQLSKNTDNPVKLRPVDQAERQKFAKQGKDVQKSQAERQKLEAKTSASSEGQEKATAKASEPESVKLAKSPIAATGTGKDQEPPKPHEVPKPDLKVEPKARTAADRTATAKGTPKTPKETAKPLTSNVPPKADVKPGAKESSKPMPAPKALPKPEPNPAPAPKVNPKPEPMPAPKLPPKPEPKGKPGTEPKVKPPKP